MLSPSDQEYFDWLISQIEIPRTFQKSFHGLFEKLHNTQFIWSLPGDDNRAKDALDLRHGFTNIVFKPYVSVLETMIPISRSLEFVAGGSAHEWMWQLLENVGLNHFYDPISKQRMQVVDRILETLIWRTYEYNGRGGFFPLINPHEDQTRVEIWYQLNAYVLEIVQN